MGFCTDEQAEKFLKGVPLVEQAMVESGILLLKYWLEVSPQEQTRRLEDRIDDGRKVWKLTAMDLKSYSRWFDYSRARDEMFAATDTALRRGTWSAECSSTYASTAYAMPTGISMVVRTSPARGPAGIRCSTN